MIFVFFEALPFQVREPSIRVVHICKSCLKIFTISSALRELRPVPVLYHLVNRAVPRKVIALGMPKFQFEVALALVVGALCSLTFSYVTRAQEGGIKLPIRAEENQETERDPFDVTGPDDLVEGYPVKEDAFWAQVRLDVAQEHQRPNSLVFPAYRWPCES